jgi:S-DNA-T family DNA segregation ATPase FtsK/SpoIIIE
MREPIRDILLDILRRRLAEMVGFALAAAVALFALALVSWSVRDPSLNHAVDGPVRNWLGWPGAVAADVAVQLFGLAILAVLAPIFAWGLTLIRHRSLDRLFGRFGAHALGVLAASGFASLLPRADSWPLPTGLGGAVGDAIERLPLMIIGASGPAKIAAALLFAVIAIVALHMATVRDPEMVRAEAEEEERWRRSGRDDGDLNDEPSKAILLLGALIHGGVLAVRGTAHAVRSFREGAGRKIADSARRAVESATREDQAAYALPGGGRLPASQREARLDARPEGRAEPRFEPAARPDAHRTESPRTEPLRPDPVLRREPSLEPASMSEVAAPVYRRAPAAAPPAPPAAEAPPAGYGAAVAALQQAAKRRLGLLSRTAPAPVPVAPPVDGARPGERAAIEALQAAARRRMVERQEPSFEPTEEPEAAPAPRAAWRAIPPIDTPEEAFEEPARVQAPAAAPAPASRVVPPAPPAKPGRRAGREAQPDLLSRGDYELPPLALLNEPKKGQVAPISEDALEQNARLLEGVLEDFGVKGEIINVRPGPVVTLYELEPAPGTKSSRVISLADDIARSMSAISARVAVVPGRNAIGIELPNQRRETVYFRELIGSQDFERSTLKLALSMGKTIGGEPVVAELAKMPHLLVAGTTGSGKSVAINTMILSLLYRLTPSQCRLIMIDPKMLELSVYDGIPHLLTPVVTDPKKAVVALKWAVREMEDRYRKMSKVGVRNIDGFNARVAEARATGEVITRTVQSGFDKETGEILYEQEEMPLDVLPYIVVIIDEMADLMMVAGKEIEGAVQRLAQMARAAGIHVVMATQRPSVDVITGTIKANFPTRISFQVTSKIDSRTILGEMGAEQLLGQGDMLYMAGGGRINRIHGPFVSDEEVERVVNHLKRQGAPQYLDAITREEDESGPEEGDDSAVFDKGEFGEEGGDLYEQAVKVVLRDKKASTSYIQRRLQIGYNRAASLMERMENEGVVGPANHAGKREILVEGEE